MSELITDSGDVQGAMGFVFLAAVPLTLILSFLTRTLYRRAVQRAMFNSAAGTAGVGAGEAGVQPHGAGWSRVMNPPLPPPDLRPLVSEVAPLPPSPNLRPRLGILYLLAGVAYGVSATVCYFVVADDIGFRPVRFIVVAMTFGWPGVPAALHFAGLRLRSVALGTVGYTMLLLPAGLVGGIGLQVFVLPLLLVLPAAVVGLILANRIMRTTSLVMFTMSIFLLGSMLMALDVALLVVRDVGEIALPGALVFTVLVGAGVGLFAAKGIAVVTTRSSDLTIQSDAIWLFVTFWLVALTVGESGVRALIMLIPFAVYRLTLHLLGRRSADPDAPLLLLLRVFGNREGQEELAFGTLTHWRQLGPVVLLGAADLATETLDPPELSAFLNFATPSLFIKSPQDLDRRMEEALRQTTDGLYPIRDFYCQGDIWRPTANVLMSRAAAVILDLRGFGPANAGTRWEIGQLVRRVQIERVVVLCDDTTDLGFASQLFAYEWHQHTGIGLSAPGSPPPVGAATVRFNIMS